MKPPRFDEHSAHLPSHKLVPGLREETSATREIVAKTTCKARKTHAQSAQRMPWRFSEHVVT